MTLPDRRPVPEHWGMTTEPDTATAAMSGAPAVLKTSSSIWLVLGVAGTVWALMGLLIVLAFGGMVPPQTYLPALALYAAGEAVFVAGSALSVLLRRGSRLARLVLSAYAVIIPAFFYVRGGPSAGDMPWQALLLSPVGAVVAAAVAATVFMWLPPANAYVARGGAQRLGSPAASELPPQTVVASVWILVVAGALAALQALLGLALLAGTIGSGGNATPALVLWLTLALVAAADLACARAVQRGKPAVRPVVTVIPLAGLVLVVLATLGGYSSISSESPAAAGGVLSMLLLTVLSEGLPLIGGMVPAVLVWLPAARRYFHRGAEVLPADAIGS